MKSEYVSSIQKCRVKRKSLQALKVNKHFGSSKRKKSEQTNSTGDSNYYGLWYDSANYYRSWIIDKLVNLFVVVVGL